MPRYKYSIAACARWESDYIVEWVEYYKSLGFEHFYIYSNDDQPEDLYQKLYPYTLGSKPMVTYRYYSILGRQREMYLHFLDCFREETEWVAFLDMDEFLALKGMDNIHTFMGDYEKEWDSIYFNWIQFGNSGFENRSSGSVLKNYTRRQASIHPYTKALTRIAKVDPGALRDANMHGFWHGWDRGPVRGSELFGLKCCNVVQETMDCYYENFPEGAETYVQRPDVAQALLEKAVIHHYVFKSERDFVLRARRGTEGEFAGQEHWGSLFAQGGHRSFLEALNAVEDTYLRDYWLKIVPDPQTFGVLPSQSREDIARKKHADQSSICQYSIGKDTRTDAGRAVNGEFEGTYAFHTAFEEHPWWCVDLGRPYEIAEINIFNRIETSGFAKRAESLSVLVSLDGQSWIEIFANPHGNHIGGIDGKFLHIHCAPPVTARYARVQLRGKDFLHLHQVQIFSV